MMLLKIGNLISLLLAIAWLVKTPDWEPAILSFGLFMTLITQELKQSSFDKKNSKKEDLNTLYIKTHEMLEELIKSTRAHEETNLNTTFSQLTAEIRMIAPEPIVIQYNKVADSYHEWVSLYFKAYPKPKNGFHIVYSQNADPTKKYKTPEKRVYRKFYKEYEKLIEVMRLEIQNKL